MLNIYKMQSKTFSLQIWAWHKKRLAPRSSLFAKPVLSTKCKDNSFFDNSQQLSVKNLSIISECPVNL